MTPSKSTDKLQLLIATLPSIPKDVLLKVKTFKLTWENFGSEGRDPLIIPEIKITFYE